MDIIAHLIDRSRRRFLKSRNPLHVWEAYRLSRGRVSLNIDPSGSIVTSEGTAKAPPALPMPEWVATYLDMCADALLTGEDPTDALLMTVASGRTKYPELVTAERNEALAYFVDILISLESADALKHVTSLEKNGQLTRDEVEDIRAVIEKGRPTIDRISHIVAAITERPGNPFSDKALTFSAVRSVYFKVMKEDV